MRANMATQCANTVETFHERWYVDEQQGEAIAFYDLLADSTRGADYRATEARERARGGGRQAGAPRDGVQGDPAADARGTGVSRRGARVQLGALTQVRVTEALA
jgi:hypothetical protein